MITLNEDNKAECDKAIIEAIEKEYSADVWEEKYAEFSIGTDSEADEAWDESLENYIDECILPELPENMRYYFNNEKWKSDAKHDGRGHSLSSYDGNELEATVDGETIYIYRTN